MAAKRREAHQCLLHGLAGDLPRPLLPTDHGPQPGQGAGLAERPQQGVRALLALRCGQPPQGRQDLHESVAAVFLGLLCRTARIAAVVAVTFQVSLLGPGLLPRICCAFAAADLLGAASGGASRRGSQVGQVLQELLREQGLGERSSRGGVAANSSKRRKSAGRSGHERRARTRCNHADNGLQSARGQQLPSQLREFLVTLWILQLHALRCVHRQDGAQTHHEGLHGRGMPWRQQRGRDHAQHAGTGHLPPERGPARSCGERLEDGDLELRHVCHERLCQSRHKTSALGLHGLAHGDCEKCRQTLRGCKGFSTSQVFA
mmetsp:Transcript_39314/g.117574  ORF Transcript_39314/g.117574 Transcript_39314/m.117574 type:complete len:318 (+) Transcript_39314:442-1395(+)